MNCKIIRPGRLTSASKPLETVRTIGHTVLIRFPNIRKGAGCPSISLKPYFFHALRAKLRPDMSGTQFETV